MNIRLSSVLLWNLQHTIAVLITTLGYAKVPNIFYELATFNLLNNISGITSRLRCQSWCSSTSNCTLSCYNGNYCFLSSALVAPYWIPKAEGGYSLTAYTNFMCYSNWIFENDLTTHVYAVTGSIGLDGNFLPANAVNGYYVDAYRAMYLANSVNYAWIQMDMRKPYSIQKIIIKIAGNQENDVLFENVEARVGNESFSSSGIKITINSFFAHYTEPANYGDVVTLTSSTPVVGRFITLQQLTFEYFRFGEIKIIGFEI